MENTLFNVKGFINSSNSCFMDTVLMSMYCYKNSPFFDFFKKDWDFTTEKSDEINFSITDNDILFRKEIKKNMIKMLKDIFEENKNVNASLLRSITENYFKWKNGSVSNDLQFGQNDPTEFYDRIVKIFNFNPIVIITVRQSRIENSNKIIKEKKVKEKMAYINIENDETDFDGLQRLINPEWVDLGEDKSNWKHNNKNISTYRYTRNVVSSLEGKGCLVFYLNRTSFREGRLYKCKNKVTMPIYINLNNRKFFLFSYIIHLSPGNIASGGHYITLFYDTKEYFIYDDMSGKEISDCKIEESKIKKLKDENTIMYFYYPI
jgi:hypothetical protein